MLSGSSFVAVGYSRPVTVPDELVSSVRRLDLQRVFPPVLRWGSSAYDVVPPPPPPLSPLLSVCDPCPVVTLLSVLTDGISGV